MSELLKINVNEHTEKKNGLTYLSWAWAWAEVLKVDPRAKWGAVTTGPAQSAVPFIPFPDGSAMVEVAVTIKSDTKTCLLPVMNHRNQAIKNPDAFAVNTAIMRCLAKAIAMHGLGLYIYAGEDLPESDEKPEADTRPDISAPNHQGVREMVSDGAGAEVSADRTDYLYELADEIKANFSVWGPKVCAQRITGEQLEMEELLLLSAQFPHPMQTAIKKAMGEPPQPKPEGTRMSPGPGLKKTFVRTEPAHG